MVSSEWWAWEGVSLSVSVLGPVALAVNSILLSFSSILFQIPQSMGIATAVRVGNLLGAGRPYEARLAAVLALILSVITSGFNRCVPRGKQFAGVLLWGLAHIVITVLFWSSSETRLHTSSTPIPK